MSDDSRLDVARACYDAYVSGDRGVVERLLADEIAFFSPADPASTGLPISSAAGPTAS